VEAVVKRMYGVCVVGREDSIRERFYAISVEKRRKPPAVVAVTRAARQALFAGRLRDGSQPRRRPHRTYGTWRPGGRGPAARRGAARKKWRRPLDRRTEFPKLVS